MSHPRLNRSSITTFYSIPQRSDDELPHLEPLTIWTAAIVQVEFCIFKRWTMGIGKTGEWFLKAVPVDVTKAYGRVEI